MRISDWSSDVFSSDLLRGLHRGRRALLLHHLRPGRRLQAAGAALVRAPAPARGADGPAEGAAAGLGRLEERGGSGGAEGNRTPDLRIANATLSHLSYSPTGVSGVAGLDRTSTRLNYSH